MKRQFVKPGQSIMMDEFFHCRKLNEDLTVMKCLQLQEKGLKTFGPNAAKFNSCPCSQGDEMKARAESEAGSFQCAKLGVIVLKKVCHYRQIAVTETSRTPLYPICHGCKRGEKIMAESRGEAMPMDEATEWVAPPRKPESGAIDPGTGGAANQEVEEINLQENESGAETPQITLGGARIRQPEMPKVEEVVSVDRNEDGYEKMGGNEVKHIGNAKNGNVEETPRKKSNTRRGTCINCKREDMIIVSGGLDWMCWQAAKGLTGEVREQALLEIKKRIDGGYMRLWGKNKKRSQKAESDKSPVVTDNDGGAAKSQESMLQEAVVKSPPLPALLEETAEPQTCIPIKLQLTVELTVRVNGIVAC